MSVNAESRNEFLQIRRDEDNFYPLARGYADDILIRYRYWRNHFYYWINPNVEFGLEVDIRLQCWRDRFFYYFVNEYEYAFKHNSINIPLPEWGYNTLPVNSDIRLAEHLLTEVGMGEPVKRYTTSELLKMESELTPKVHKELSDLLKRVKQYRARPPEELGPIKGKVKELEFMEDPLPEELGSMKDLPPQELESMEVICQRIQLDRLPSSP